MKLNVKILVGIGGSGKTTWSKEYVLNNVNTKRLNRDDLRGMLDSYKDTTGNDNFVKLASMKLLELCLLSDRNVVIDDTNCYYDKLNELITNIRILALNLGKDIEVEVVDFNIPIDICIERNNFRERVLKKMYYIFNKEVKMR